MVVIGVGGVVSGKRRVGHKSVESFMEVAPDELMTWLFQKGYFALMMVSIFNSLKIIIMGVMIGRQRGVLELLYTATSLIFVFPRRM